MEIDVSQFNLRLPERSGYSLFFSSRSEQDDYFTSIQEKTEHQAMISEVIKEAERLIRDPDQPLTYALFRLFFENGSRKEYEKVYFEKRRKLTTFALAVLLRPDCQEYLDFLHETIWSVCNEFTWCLPAHLQNSPELSTDVDFSVKVQGKTYTIDLFATETAFALSEIIQLLRHQLEPFLVKQMEEEIYRRVLQPFMNQPEFEWETADHNWAAVCAGSIGAAALHMLDNEQELSNVLERVIPSINGYLNGFHQDGACIEGYGYWEYGFGFFVYFADLLKKRSHGMVDFFSSEKVHQIALFQQKVFLDRQYVVNFSDAPSKSFIFLGLSHYLGKIYDDFEIPEQDLQARFIDDHCSRWAPALRNLLWFDDLLEGRPWKAASYILEDSQWFISRHHSTEGRFALAAKGGHNDEPHNHNDVGHFLLYGNGETFLLDLGRGLYNKDYFGEKRYSFLCNGSHGHSVPILNGSFQQEGAERSASLLGVSVGGETEEFEIDLTNTYPDENLQSLTRRFEWTKSLKPSLEVTDTYSFTNDTSSMVERFITSAMPSAKKDGEVLLGRKEDVRVTFDQNQCHLQVGKICFTNHFGEMEENYVLDFFLKPNTHGTVTFLFEFT